MRLLDALLLLLVLPLMVVAIIVITVYSAGLVLATGRTVTWESPVSWKVGR